MEQSMQASKNGVAFRRPTFNPNRVIANFFRGILGFLESAARAQAAHRLYSLGYHQEAKDLILGKNEK